MRVAPEGRPLIAIGWVVLAVFALVAWLAGRGWWTVLPLAWTPVALWIPWFFRDPVRHGSRGVDLVLAPADGRIVDVSEVDEPDFFAGKSKRVSVFMNVFDVHVNRYPVDGTVEYRNYRPGKFVNASLDKASADNEQMSLGIRTGRGRVLVRQIAGLVARRIVTDAEPGSEVRQGERLGLIRFGSRVDTFLPCDVRVVVNVGDKTKAGITILARWSQ
ncbi:MAG: phosphatidylserine decarboxylase family protein [Gemmatimonadales bacterium]